MEEIATMSQSINQRSNWDHRLKTLAVATALLFTFSIFYHAVIFYQGYLNSASYDQFFSLNSYIDNAGLQCLTLLFFILFVWYILFVVMKKVEIKIRLLSHLITLPLLVILSKKTFYVLSEALGYTHLEGGGQVWDIFIPSFFYLVIFTFFHGAEYYYQSQRRFKEKKKFETDSLKNELKAIKAQLNPHFLYNVFNTINASIPREQEHIREMIADVSDLFRYQLKASELDLLSLSEEVASIKTYLRLEKKRFGDRLQLEIDIDPNCLTKKVPPMLIQPLVENAIKHGMPHATNHLKVALKIWWDGQKTMQVRVTDTGVGIENIQEALKKGFGLRHTHQRLERFYGSHLHIQNNKPHGLITQFSL